jgi:hypothetical protein
MREQRRLTVMPAIEVPSSDASILRAQHPGPVFHGEGNIDYVCGACSHVLVEGATPGVSFKQVYFLCFGCGAMNLADDG